MKTRKIPDETLRRIIPAVVIISIAIMLIPAAAFAVPSPASLASVKGSVSIRPDAESDWEKARTGDELTEAYQIKTGPGAEAVIKWKAGHLVKVYALTITTLEKLSASGKTEHTQLNVESGKIFAKAQKINGDSSFSVKTPTAVAAVRGTEFMVEVGADQSSMISLLEGQLDISNDVLETILDQNSQVEVTPDMQEATPEDLDPGTRDEMETESAALDSFGGGEKGEEKSGGGNASQSSVSTDQNTVDVIQNTIDDVINNEMNSNITTGGEEVPVPPMPPDR